MTVGKNIKEARINKGISQEKLAGSVFSRSYISQIERDAILPSFKAIEHIAKTLNIPTVELLDSKSIFKIINKDKIFDLFLKGRKLYLEKDYIQCIEILSMVILAEDGLSSIDLISAKVWLSDAYFQISKPEKALALCNQYFGAPSDYTRGELAIALKLIYIKGIILYDIGHYQDSLACFLTIEETIEDRQLDIEKTLILDNLSRLQMLYESLGHNDKVEQYRQRVLEFSKKFHMISKGTLRSINRYYRDHSTDSVEEMVAFYESLIDTAHLIGDTYRVAVLRSSIVELYLKHDCLSELETYLEKAKVAIMDLENSSNRGYNMAFYYLFSGRYHVKLKAFDKALDCYTKAQAYISNSEYSKSIKLEIDSLYNYAELYYEKGEMESAKLYIQMAENASMENATTVRNDKINQLKNYIFQEICL